MAPLLAVSPRHSILHRCQRLPVWCLLDAHAAAIFEFRPRARTLIGEICFDHWIEVAKANGAEVMPSPLPIRRREIAYP